MNGDTSGGAPANARDVVVVVPCFNEARRLDTAAFAAYASVSPDVRFLFVDDGSTDQTLEILEKLCRSNPKSLDVLALTYNRGKAEAVRLGILHAAATRPAFVGFWDADLATPLSEIARLRAVFDERPETQFVLGSRVNLLGRDVNRKASRHYLGRIFATAVAAALHLAVYDTQCGAKLMRCCDEVLDLFREPFFAEWIFDAELLARAIDARGENGWRDMSKVAFEQPLLQWEDVDGSNIRPRDLLGAGRDAVRIYARHLTIGRWYRGTRGRSARIAAATRSILARMSTDREHVSVAEKGWRGALLTPVFGMLLAWTRVRAWLIGPLELPATTKFGDDFACQLPDHMQTYLYLFGVWEPDITAFMRRRLEPDDTFVDVGANVGYHTLLANRIVGPGGRVVAIEASPTICERLGATLAANGAPGSVRTVNRAVSDTHDRVVMYRGPVRNIGLSTTVEPRGFAQEAQVASAPLADLLEPAEIGAARLVKIDVAGGEVAVLRGMTTFLEACRPDVEIIVELSPQWWTDPEETPQRLLQPFIDAGFHLYEIDNSVSPRRYLCANSVRAPRRLRRDPSKRVARLALVLSRVDAETL